MLAVILHVGSFHNASTFGRKPLDVIVNKTFVDFFSVN